MKNPEAMGSVNGFSVDVDSFSHDSDNDRDQSLPVDTTDQFLEEMDSYWDDINSRLTVSRMVGDSVVKGIVAAVEGEAAEKVALKETEIATLNERLRYYESALAKENRLDVTGLNSVALTMMVEPRMPIDLHSLDASAESKFHKPFHKLKSLAQQHIKQLKDGLENIRVTLSVGKSKLFASDAESLNIPAEESTSGTLDMIDGCLNALEGVVEATHHQIDKILLASNPSSGIQQHGDNFQREADSSILQKLISELHAEIETKVREQKVLTDTFNEKWQKTAGELSIMREELTAISSALSSELGLVHHNLDSSEEWNNPKRKEHAPWKVLTQTSHSAETDNVQMEKTGEVPNSLVNESPQLLKMTKEGLISYFRNVMTNMKRQHDSALQEKTEELFSLKREFLKEKGSNPLHFRRDKDLELRKKINEIISKLDDIAMKSKETSSLPNQQWSLLSLKQKMDNLYLQSSSTIQYNKSECLTFQTSDGSQMSLTSQIEECLLEQNSLLASQESRYLEAIIKNDIESIALTTLVDEVKYDAENVGMACKVVEDMCFVILKACIQDAISSMDSFLEKHRTNQDVIAGALSEKDEALFVQMEENMNLRQESESLFMLLEDKERIMLETEFRLIQEKELNSLLRSELNILQDEVSKQKEKNNDLRQEIESLFASLEDKEKLMLEIEFQSSSFYSELNLLQGKVNKLKEEKKNLSQEIESLFALIEEKEKLFLETHFRYILEKEQHSLFFIELNKLQDKVNKQALVISEHKKQSDLMKGKLDEMSREIEKYQAALSETNKKLEVASHALMEAEKEKNILRSIMEEKQINLESTRMEEVENANEMKFMISSMAQSSEAMLLFETTILRKLEFHRSRLNSISNHCSQATQQANFLRRKSCWYKQGFEARCSDLQKAENEVDLLGDEVDALIRLLEKIYLVLEHYYPVLQHYPGVADILKLIRREMKKEPTELK